MASFCAGFIKSIDIKGDISQIVYNQATKQLDTYSIKASAVKNKNGVNYVAFLSKTKLIKENILQTVEKVIKKGVVVFEVDYKKVGVICENGTILDYILDEVILYAKANDLQIYEASNTKGNSLVLYNIAKEKQKSKFSFLLSTFVFTIVTVIGVGVLYYINSVDLNLKNKDNLTNQYIALVNKNFDRAKNEIKNPDFVETITKLEDICTKNNIRLKNITYKEKMFCISFKEEVDGNIFRDFKLYKTNPTEVIYCSEKI